MSNIPWRSNASWDVISLRAEILRAVRAYFATHEFIEVETPILSDAATPDPHLHSFLVRSVDEQVLGVEGGYLHTSPEYAMKRLLAQFRCSIYQICKVFRAGERGRLHNTEFTLIEWYQVASDYQTFMREMDRFIQGLIVPHLAFELMPTEFVLYREAYQRCTGVDPFIDDAQSYINCAQRHSLLVPQGVAADDREALRDWLLTELVEPSLGQQRLTFMYDYPIEQAALARIRNAEVAVAERFELYFMGVELANGFQELIDGMEQHVRLKDELARRVAMGMQEVELDERFLEALRAGMPETCGVALGLDRLLMLITGHASIDKVLSFSRAYA